MYNRVELKVFTPMLIAYDVIIWLAQSIDNSKWFAWSPQLWVNESRL